MLGCGPGRASAAQPQSRWLEAAINHDSADDKPVMTPNELLEAVLMNDTRNVSILVQECGVDVNALDAEGRHSFLEAAERGIV